MPGAALAGRLGGLYRFLLNKWYFDELYDRLFVRPAHFGSAAASGRRATGADRRARPGRAGGASQGCSRAGQPLQSGYVYHYAFAMLIGVAAS